MNEWKGESGNTTRAVPSPIDPAGQPRSLECQRAVTELTLREAQRLVDRWMTSRGWVYWQPLAQLARMTEELGELARLVNHLHGEKPKKLDEAEQELGLELADLLYTMICLANSQGIDLQDALERVLAKYQARDATRYGPLATPEAPAPAGSSRDHS